jgi:hypothetical protein
MKRHIKIKNIYFVTSFITSIFTFVYYYLFFTSLDCGIYLSIVQGFAFGLSYFLIVIPENLKVRVVLIIEILFLSISQVFYYILYILGLQITYSLFVIPVLYIAMIFYSPIVVVPSLSYIILVSYYQRKLFHQKKMYIRVFYYQFFTSIPYWAGSLWWLKCLLEVSTDTE